MTMTMTMTMTMNTKFEFAEGKFLLSMLAISKIVNFTGKSYDYNRKLAIDFYYYVLYQWGLVVR